MILLGKCKLNKAGLEGEHCDTGGGLLVSAFSFQLAILQSPRTLLLFNGYECDIPDKITSRQWNVSALSGLDYLQSFQLNKVFEQCVAFKCPLD